MKITARGRAVAIALVMIIGFVVGIATADWSYYELEGSHSISELGR